MQGTVQGEGEADRKEMGRQHPGMDGLDTGRRHAESGETRRMEGAGCKVICGAPTVHLRLRDRQGKARQGKARQGKARQGKARQGKARQGKARQGKARQGKARQGKARQGKARQGKARQGKARQGKARCFERM